MNGWRQHLLPKTLTFRFGVQFPSHAMLERNGYSDISLAQVYIPSSITRILLR